MPARVFAYTAHGSREMRERGYQSSGYALHSSVFLDGKLWDLVGLKLLEARSTWCYMGYGDGPGGSLRASVESGVPNRFMFFFRWCQEGD